MWYDEEEHKNYLVRLVEQNKNFFKDYQDNLKRIEEENDFLRRKYEAQREYLGSHNSFYDVRRDLRENAMTSLRSYGLMLEKFKLP